MVYVLMLYGLSVRRRVFYLIFYYSHFYFDTKRSAFLRLRKLCVKFTFFFFVPLLFAGRVFKRLSICIFKLNNHKVANTRPSTHTPIHHAHTHISVWRILNNSRAQKEYRVAY